MGQYIHPASSAQEQGVNIPCPPSWAAAQALLSRDERLAAVADRPHGKVALVIEREADLDHVRQVGADIYIISCDLIR